MIKYSTLKFFCGMGYILICIIFFILELITDIPFVTNKISLGVITFIVIILSFIAFTVLERKMKNANKLSEPQ
jgi:hypothetical protein